VLQKIKNELLIFAVFSILIITTFPSLKIWIFLIYIIGIILYTIIKVSSVYNKKSNNRFLDNFNEFLVNSDNWEKRQIDHFEVYFYKENNNYQIKKADTPGEKWSARESWMEKFPDPSIIEYSVYLKHGESLIASYRFLSCDGGRYFIPLPQKKCLKEDTSKIECLEWEYFWDEKSIDFKLGKIIGDFYRCDSLEEVANFCNIKIYK
jgi:hypothetical protein